MTICDWLPKTSSDLAAWVQAIGSVGALAWAVRIYWKDRAETAEDLRLGTVELIKYADYLSKQIEESTSDHLKLFGLKAKDIEDLGEARDQLKAIPIMNIRPHGVASEVIYAWRAIEGILAEAGDAYANKSPNLAHEKIDRWNNLIKRYRHALSDARESLRTGRLTRTDPPIQEEAE